MTKRERHLDLAKANPPPEVADGYLTITIPIPDHFPNLEEAADFYKQQATILENFLHETLPGGTYDRLAICIMQRKASHFRVSWGPPDEPR